MNGVELLLLISVEIVTNHWQMIVLKIAMVTGVELLFLINVIFVQMGQQILKHALRIAMAIGAVQPF